MPAYISGLDVRVMENSYMQYNVFLHLMGIKSICTTRITTIEKMQIKELGIQRVLAILHYITRLTILMMHIDKDSMNVH